jgi:hypothetical protein
MLIADVRKKWNVKLTIVDTWTGPEDKMVGQLWEYFVPSADHPKPKHDETNWFQFVPKYVPEFEPLRVSGDGYDDKNELLQTIKTKYQALKRYCLVNETAQLLFSLTPVDVVF